MRNTTAGELTALASRDRDEWVRLRINDSVGTLQDYTDWLKSWSVSRDQDTFVWQGSFTLHREKSDETLAPLMRDPKPIEMGRRIVLDVAVLDINSAAPGASDWHTLFDGRIDDTIWGGDTLELPCRGPGREMHEAWVEAVSERGSDAGQPVEELIQELLDEVLGVDEVVLQVEGTPDWGIRTYNQERQRLSEACQALADTQGWELIWLWDDTAGDFQLTYREPDRTAITPAHTFTADDYFVVPRMELTSLGRRTVVIVQWDATNEVVAEDTAAIAEPGMGRRPVFIDAAQDPQIDNGTRATALADAILADLSQPALAQGIEHALFWPVEIGDFYEWSANNVHYDAAQDMAVVSYEHRGDDSDSPFTTTIFARGKPSGGTHRWYKRTVKDRNAQDTRSRIRDSDLDTPIGVGGSVSAHLNENTGDVSATLRGFPKTSSWKVAAKIGGPPSKAEIEAETALNGQDQEDTDVGTLLTASEGNVVFVAAIAYSEVDAGGDESSVIAATASWGVDTPQIAPGAVIADKMRKGAQQFSSDVSFSSTQNTVVSWSAGTVRTADGAAVAVNSGSTGSMSVGDRRFIYFDGTDTLKVTGNFADVTSGEDHIMMCFARAQESGQEAFFVPAVGAMSGGVRIGRDQLSANSIAANKIRANAVTASKINVISLSAIQADMGTLTAGEISVGSMTLSADSETLTFGAATAPTTGTGIFIGLSGGVYHARFGNPSGSHIHWDGSNLTVAGTLEGADGTFSGNITSDSLDVGSDTSNDIRLRTGSGVSVTRIEVRRGGSTKLNLRASTHGEITTGTGANLVLNPSDDLDLNVPTSASAGASDGFITVLINGTAKKLEIFNV